MTHSATGLRLAAVLSLLAACAPAGRAQAAEPPSLSAPGVAVTATPDGAVEIQGAGGRPRLTVAAYRLLWSPPETDGGAASVEKARDGSETLKVVYKVKGDPTGTVRVEGRFTAAANRVHLRYDVWGPDDLKTGGAMIEIRPQPQPATRTDVQLAHWERPASGGGVPFEAPDGQGVDWQWADGTRALVALKKSRAQWRTPNALHFPAEKTGGGHFVAEGDVVLEKGRPAAAGAILGGRPLSVELWTDPPFHVWDSAAQPLAVHAQTVNVSTAPRRTTVTWRARDFDGRVVAEGSDTRDLTPGETWDETLSIPAPGRGIYFIEAEAKAGDAVAFVRTTAAVLPPHAFQAGDDSLFGIAAYFPQPSPAEATKFLRRIGVRWVRMGRLPKAEADAAGLAQNAHSSISRKDAEADPPEKTAAWIDKQLSEADADGARYWESCNEWNMSGLGTGAGAKTYVEKVLIPADERRRATGAKVRLMTQGLAGGDLKFIDAIHDAGGWEHFDAFALHPGRGNYTPDYAGPDYWNFLGTIREVKAKLARYGEKPLWVTEAYACTQANAWWHDTERHAAENVVLSYALAAAEGVRVMDWYQLNDSVWYDVGGAKPADSEYSYGLLHRDLSPKPSLLAYETIAEALDRAKFVRWLTFPDAKQKGLLFDTPRGPMTVLWHRADGYVLNGPKPKDGKTFAAPEPWIDDWKTKVTVTLPATGATVRVIDCIGRETSVPVRNGKATVILDGAPRIFYGLAAGG